MDAHYHKVMAARDAVAETNEKLYFAYSSVLDREAFETWRQEHSYEFFDLPQGQVAKALDIDLVYDFRSRWWGGRVAGLTDKKGSEIYGLLFSIPAKNWPIVQHKEGAVTGMCIEREVQVQVGDQKITAIAFTTSPARATQEGPISTDYIAALVSGAKQAGLPENYIQRLSATQA